MGLVTHLPPLCNALDAERVESFGRPPTRRCEGCGCPFEITRPWQKHCSPRCRVRVYRRAQVVQGYYGA